MKQVSDTGGLHVRTLRIEVLRSDGVTIDIGSLSGGPDMPNTAMAHPKLVRDKRWRDLVFNALFDWMGSVLEAADDQDGDER
ncbi:hypothetical protein [Bifidobacterium aerophilum]|uniref:Uncharacterized protein n=1 Tax=Bifidobacterium aerophilum TaxID=1798155 RepID=A0A6N9Z7A5_9BIFI|nr:hypothetical protein [Bifidobacterium aerophilum]NEG90589.1 hypothetical protein [Bifidobacterium aerophilum]